MHSRSHRTRPIAIDQLNFEPNITSINALYSHYYRITKVYDHQYSNLFLRSQQIEFKMMFNQSIISNINPILFHPLTFQWSPPFRFDISSTTNRRHIFTNSLIVKALIRRYIISQKSILECCTPRSPFIQIVVIQSTEFRYSAVIR